MKNPKILFSSIALAVFAASLHPSSAFAREKGGNGGNAAVCFNSSVEVDKVKKNGDQIANNQMDKITSIRALELYQAEASFKGHVPPGSFVLASKTETPENYTRRIAERFAHTLPSITLEIESRLAMIEKDQNDKKTKYFTEGGIDRIYDTAADYYLDPSRCVVATLIRRTNIEGGVHLEYDWRLFNHPKHSNQSRGVIVLHEAVYKWATDLNQEDSRGTRDLIADGIIRKNVHYNQILTEAKNDGFSVSVAGYFEQPSYVFWEKEVNHPIDLYVGTPLSKAVIDSLRETLQISPELKDLGGLMTVMRNLIAGKSYIFKDHPRQKEADDLKNAMNVADENLKFEIMCSLNNDHRFGGYTFTHKQQKECAKQIPTYEEAAKTAHANYDAIAAIIQADQRVIASNALVLAQAEYRRVNTGATELFRSLRAKVAAQTWLRPEIVAAAKKELDVREAEFAVPFVVPASYEGSNAVSIASTRENELLEKMDPVIE